MLKLYYWLLSGFCIISIASAASISKSYDYGTSIDIDLLPTPEQLADVLGEDEFEDYLDYWLYQKTIQELKLEAPVTTNGCTIPITSLIEPLPIYVTSNGLLKASGTTGTIVVSALQNVEAACTGSGLFHGSSSTNPSLATLRCSKDLAFTSTWISGLIQFDNVLCLKHPTFLTRQTGTCLGGGVKIDAILDVGSKSYSILTSCFRSSNAEVFYVEYDQTPENRFFQPNVERPLFDQGSHFPNLDVQTLYTQVRQKLSFDKILGSNMNLRYINATYFLARGHLAAKSDYLLAPEQRATFTFVNAAPQWQPFNGGNWNTLEQNLRARIAAAGYRTKIYTGTHGILRLADYTGVFRDIYLNPETKQIPVPMWFYKVVYEPSQRRGVVFLGLNNPHVSLEQARQLAFCKDVCTGNSAFSWINWNPIDIGRGFSLCCDIDDFRQTVKVLPAFVTDGILA